MNPEAGRNRVLLTQVFTVRQLAIPKCLVSHVIFRVIFEIVMY